MKKDNTKYITQATLMSQYHLTRSMIDRFLPEPVLKKNPHYSKAAPMKLWKESDVINLLSENKTLAKTIAERTSRRAAKKEKALERAKLADEYLKQFSPDDLIEQGKALKRHFTLHVGPTNSGKTYQALQALKAAGNGLYLGPLRLLALEMFETLNMDGYPCDLLTGEEFESIPCSKITSSTIELCDFDNHYSVAVIDEAQLISEPFRGSSWTNAICLVDAEEVHVCMAPEALSLIEKLLRAMETPYDIVKHDRLVPLEFKGSFSKLEDVQNGDALIAFSRKKVLAISAALEKQGIKSSVIYGALPPAARREETRRFAEKETTVVVATDAIGMGISLPIKRIIFTQTDKFDGKEQRLLKTSEVKQISGRAGRFGKYDMGEVLSMNNNKYINECLNEEIEEISKLQIAFPKIALEYDYPLDKLLKQWDELPKNDAYDREDMKEAEYLLDKLGNLSKQIDKELIYNLICCPVDIKNDLLVSYWYSCCKSIIDGTDVEKPNFSEYSLELCEVKYQAYDIYHQLLRRIGIEDDCLEDKERLCKKINKFLLQKKKEYLHKCKFCGKELPPTYQFNVCEYCHKNHYAK